MAGRRGETVNMGVMGSMGVMGRMRRWVFGPSKIEQEQLSDAFDMLLCAEVSLLNTIAENLEDNREDPWQSARRLRDLAGLLQAVTEKTELDRFRRFMERSGVAEPDGRNGR